MKQNWNGNLIRVIWFIEHFLNSCINIVYKLLAMG